MKKFTTLFLFIFCAFIIPVRAGESSPLKDYEQAQIVAKQAKINARAKIDACNAASQARIDTGITSEMQQGSSDIVNCLKGEIQKLADASFEAGERARFQESLNAYIRSMGEVYYTIWNKNKDCAPSCGTMYTYMHYSDIIADLERMLELMSGKAAMWTHEKDLSK